MYGSGYHAVTDGKGGYVQMADATAGPYSAPPLNGTWWHVCMPGFANQTRDQWLDDLSVQHRLGVARFIVDCWLKDGKTYPLIMRYDGDLVLGLGGYTTHAMVSRAWHKSDHTDPGINFPLDLLAKDIEKLTTQQPSQEGNEMAKAIQVAGDPAIFAATSALTAVWMQAGVDVALRDLGLLETQPGGSAFPVPRSALKGLELRGALPNAGPTVASDFAKHTP